MHMSHLDATNLGVWTDMCAVTGLGVRTGMCGYEFRYKHGHVCVVTGLGVDACMVVCGYGFRYAHGHVRLRV